MVEGSGFVEVSISAGAQKQIGKSKTLGEESGENKKAETIRYIEPVGIKIGEVDFENQKIEILIPEITDMPIEDGYHIQVVNRSLNVKELGDTPLLSEKLDPKKYLRFEAVAAIVAQRLFEKSEQPNWVNINTHTYPPMNPSRPSDDIPDQYNSLTIDIHCKRMPKYDEVFDEKGNLRPEIIVDDNGKIIAGLHSLLEPTPITMAGPVEGYPKEVDFREETEVSEDEIRKHLQDPQNLEVLAEARKQAIATGSYKPISEHPTKTVDYYGPRRYTKEDISIIKGWFKDWNVQKEAETRLKEIRLFKDTGAEFPDFDPGWTWDIELWRFGEKGKGRYRLVTQTTPLVDPKDGMHFVVELSPESHTAWDDLEAYLSIRSIGIGLIRQLQKNTIQLKAAGEKNGKNLDPVDAAIDNNANWSLRDIAKLYEGNPDLVELKRRIYDRVRTHEHIQVFNGLWDIPPMSGTHRDFRQVSEDTVNQLREILKNPERGLTMWLTDNCQEGF